MNPEVTAYIAAAPEGQQALLEAIRRLVHEALPGVQEDFKWSRPVFRAGRDFAYLKTQKSYVTFGFYDAGGLEDPQGLLEGTGKQMRHIKLRNEGDLAKAPLKEWIRAAAIR
ncbi:DUF1801 domain-containing protein [Flaviaesturariibacter flavus]|uniref:DUF1801 domain-containing protein n=1 Tax=Flaviaesturariibacter flavus TaxID=2502780 RepID=A0A4R1BMP0_9BACT|nr:DUF1801 domain-containing protein [Flaviaesturariibacter flavus]TCJ18790.1 DUF1801 domain-containing protein [Flaviaesturariibacter flavus]